MRLLLQLMRVIARWAFVLLLQLLIGLLRILFPVLLAAIRWLFAVMRFSITATVNGPWQFTERLASEWTRRLMALGVSPVHLDEAYVFCRAIAISVLVLGWVFTTLFFVAILRIVFGIFT